ncbi:MAG: hypothetical protein HOG05_11415 [Bacteroidetes bacterium]|nr:hypothetical protein [Bacteroidota bacterium]MBT3801749.1 hypothetical protein [Bacteroidota bacterium]MBT7994870.1 hypothetical protein [Bacteroidota bacterium]
MKALKWIGIVLILLIAILFVVSLFLPSDYYTEKSKVIDAPTWSVFEEVADYNNWPKWDPWNAADTNMQSTVVGEMGVGQVRSWVSESQGNGSMETLELVENELSKGKLMFEGMDNHAFNKFVLEEVEGGTKATWSIEGDVGFNPIARYWMLLAKGQMKKSFENGLNNLQALCEAKPKEKAVVVTVETKDFEGINYIGIKHALTDKNTFGQVMGQDFQVMMAFMAIHKIEMVGVPFSRYLQWSDKDGDTIIFESCLPVADIGKGDENVYFGQIEASKVAAAMHFGAYEKIGPVYYAIEDYIAENALEIIGGPWEVYLTDPGKEPDPSKWMTEVYYPIK